MEPSQERTIRRRALRAAQVVTIALGLSAGGCYSAHDRDVPVPPPEPPVWVDAGMVDADMGDADMGDDAGPDSGPEDCVPDPDCGGTEGGDGFCDWDQLTACCDAHEWSIEGCFIGGGPLSPPEMPA